jgi:hypothetical protein
VTDSLVDLATLPVGIPNGLITGTTFEARVPVDVSGRFASLTAFVFQVSLSQHCWAQILQCAAD